MEPVATARPEDFRFEVLGLVPVANARPEDFRFEVLGLVPVANARPEDFRVLGFKVAALLPSSSSYESFG